MPLRPRPERPLLLSRREMLRSLGVGAAALPVLACGGPPSASLDAGQDAGAEPADSGLDASTVADAGQDAGPSSRWASGGTASMVDAASYPDPFEGGAPMSCPLTIATTLGPCFYTSPVRQDVSEGYPGLPLRLALQVMDPSCAPMANARVDIWHTGNSGLYSGGPIDFCTGADEDAIAHLYFRGTQTTDERGVVHFDSCYPGWYTSRTIHIHLQVFPEGGESATGISQLFFDQALTAEIFESHPDYLAYGQPAVANAGDSIYLGVGEAGIADYERMSDGAMLAWKQIIVES